MRNINELGGYSIESVGMSEDFGTRVSKYMSYLLRHNPENLRMNHEGFVQLDELLSKVRVRYPAADKRLLLSIVHGSDKKRFEIVGGKIRALYGHTIDVDVNLREDEQVAVLYHGTTPKAAREIMKTDLNPMHRKWVHLSPTKEIAFEVGKRRAKMPTILELDVVRARDSGIRFYKATNKVYLCEHVPAKYIRMCNHV